MNSTPVVKSKPEKVTSKPVQVVDLDMVDAGYGSKKTIDDLGTDEVIDLDMIDLDAIDA